MTGSASLLPSGVVLVIIAILRLLKDIVSDEKNLFVAAIMQRLFCERGARNAAAK